MAHPSTKSIHIGTMELLKPREGTTTEQNAAWYTAYILEPQTVNIKWNGYYVWVGPWEGIIREEHYPSMFGGVATGGGKVHDTSRAGETMKVPAWQIYDYEFARGLTSGRYSSRDSDLRAIIDDRLRVEGKQHRRSDGSLYWSCSLTPPVETYKKMSPWKDAA